MTEFRLGATVWITIVETNIASHTIETSGAYSGSINKVFTYEVLGEDGTPAKRVQHRHPELDALSPFWSGLRPGEIQIDEVELTAMYILDHPGKYFVTAFREEPMVKDADGKPLVEKSNTITITVLPQTTSATNDQKTPQP